MMMRKTFPFPTYDLHTWFPGHMHKGLQQMQKRIGDMDCVLEVHDARIPLTGRNPIFDRQARMRPHILMLNKIDLLDMRSLAQLKKNVQSLGATKVMFTDLKNKTDSLSRKIINETLSVMTNTERFHRTDDDAFNLLVVGIPNVGKSSLINFLRNTALGKKGKATKVGATPGVTKSVLERIRICDEPIMFLFDTPGILTPRVESAEVALKLAACNTIKSRVLGEEVICDYILYTLNQRQKYGYVDMYGLSEPSDDIHQVLTSIAERDEKTLKRRESGVYKVYPNYDYAANRMLNDFHNGSLARLCFDDEIVFPNQKAVSED